MVDLSLNGAFWGNWSVWGAKTLSNNDIGGDPNKVIDIEKWSICGGGRLTRLYCIYVYIYIYFSLYISMC